MESKALHAKLFCRIHLLPSHAKRKSFTKMKSFQVLKWNQILLSRLGVYSNEFLSESISRCQKSAANFIILVSGVLLIISSAVFVYQNSLDFNVALRMSIIALGQSQATGMFFSFVIKIDQIRQLHVKLQQIIDCGFKGKLV